MISTNPGEDLRPLDQIASGGELSRIMLALKTVVADKDDIGEEDTKVYHYTMKSKVPTGTYKMVYSIYDGNTYIGSAYEYFIVN